MSTVEAKETKRFTDADKVRTVAWLATRPKPIEADSLAGAAAEISKAIDVRLAPAVLQGILDADQSLAAKVVIGGGGAVSHLREVVEALSTRVDAIAKISVDQDKVLHGLQETVRLLSQSVQRLEEITRPQQMIGVAKGSDELPGFGGDDNDGRGSSLPPD